MFTTASIFQDVTSFVETFAALGFVAVAWAVQSSRRARRLAHMPATRRL